MATLPFWATQQEGAWPVSPENHLQPWVNGNLLDALEDNRVVANVYTSARHSSGHSTKRTPDGISGQRPGGPHTPADREYL